MTPRARWRSPQPLPMQRDTRQRSAAPRGRTRSLQRARSLRSRRRLQEAATYRAGTRRILTTQSERRRYNFDRRLIRELRADRNLRSGAKRRIGRSPRARARRLVPSVRPRQRARVPSLRRYPRFAY